MTVAWDAGTVESNGEAKTVRMMNKMMDYTDGSLIKSVSRVEMNCARNEFRIIEVSDDSGVIPGGQTEVLQIPEDSVVGLLRDAVCSATR